MHRPRPRARIEDSHHRHAGEVPSARQLSAECRVLRDESDEDLVRRCLDGDHRAYGELVVRYQGMVYTLAVRMVGNADDARELAQVAFVKAWRGLSGFDPERRFFSWLYRIAIHECLNHRRARRRFEAMEVEPESHDRGPEQQVEDLETETQVQKALSLLGQDDRQILILRHFLELSYEEIGEALGVQAKTVKSRLFTARQRLRAELVRLGAGGL